MPTILYSYTIAPSIMYCLSMDHMFPCKYYYTHWHSYLARTLSLNTHALIRTCSRNSAQIDHLIVSWTPSS